jgi:hypothetical protein
VVVSAEPETWEPEARNLGGREPWLGAIFNGGLCSPTVFPLAGVFGAERHPTSDGTSMLTSKPTSNFTIDV